MAYLSLKLAVLLLDMNEPRSAYLVLCKALGYANKRRLPVGNIMRSMNALRMEFAR